MDGLRVLDSENSGVISDNKAKREKMGRGSKKGSPLRKRLADISNIQPLPKPSKQEEKSQLTISLATTEYIDKLHKENMTLMKVLAERNNIIELSGIELQKLRINLQKVQQQNLQLAQANSQMLAELNSGKDRLKALQHELGCKNGLLKTRKFVLESKAKTVTCVSSENQVGADKLDEAGEFFEADDDNKPCNARNTRRQSKNKCLDSFIVKPVQAKEKVDDKRLSLRRQSARFKSEEAEPTEERLCKRRQSASCESEELEQAEDRLCVRRQSTLFKSAKLERTEDLLEINNAKFPVSPLRDEIVHETGQTAVHISVKKEDEEGNSAVQDETQGTRGRLSGRPSRQAAVKVQSYKEIPINVKMRRLE